jgi:hypothetical protein
VAGIVQNFAFFPDLRSDAARLSLGFRLLEATLDRRVRCRRTRVFFPAEASGLQLRELVCRGVVFTGRRERHANRALALAAKRVVQVVALTFHFYPWPARVVHTSPMSSSRLVSEPDC